MLTRNRSNTLLPSRSYSSPNGYAYTPPTPISISVDKCTSRPGFGERFAYCRYTTNPYSTTYYAYNPNMGVLEDGKSADWADTFNIYMARMAVQPRYGFNARAPTGDKNGLNDPERAVSMYQLRNSSFACAPASKYWLTPKYWEAEREKSRTKARNWATMR